MFGVLPVTQWEPVCAPGALSCCPAKFPYRDGGCTCPGPGTSSPGQAGSQPSLRALASALGEKSDSVPGAEAHTQANLLGDLAWAAQLFMLRWR